MNKGQTEAPRNYRFRVELFQALPGSDMGKLFFVETSASTRGKARDKVAWLAEQNSIKKITFCGIVKSRIVATEE